MTSPTILMVAGEASGDLHGSRLAMELRERQPGCRLLGIGGPKMEQAGVQLLYSNADFAFLGFSEVVKHLPFIRSVLRHLDRVFAQDRPDLVILIDYPGFNIKLAKKAKKKGIPVFYYISPQVWAWLPNRARVIARRVDLLAVILPFERDFYRKRAGLEAHFVGHPLLDVVAWQQSRDDFCRRWQLDPQRPLLGLLPGSRSQEIHRLLPIMLQASRMLKERMPHLQIAVGGISTLPENLYRNIIRQSGRDVRLITDQTYELMHHARLLWVASGTATLESAILGTPMIILYRVSFFSWLLALLLVRVRHIGLVNLVAGRRIVPELVQHQVTAVRIAREAARLLNDAGRLDDMAERLGEIRHRLGPRGASRRAAELALELIASRRQGG